MIVTTVSIRTVSSQCREADRQVRPEGAHRVIPRGPPCNGSCRRKPSDSKSEQEEALSSSILYSFVSAVCIKSPKELVKTQIAGPHPAIQWNKSAFLVNFLVVLRWPQQRHFEKYRSKCRTPLCWEERKWGFWEWLSSVTEHSLNGPCVPAAPTEWRTSSVFESSPAWVWILMASYWLWPWVSYLTSRDSIFFIGKNGVAFQHCSQDSMDLWMTKELIGTVHGIQDTLSKQESVLLSWLFLFNSLQ